MPRIKVEFSGYAVTHPTHEQLGEAIASLGPDKSKYDLIEAMEEQVLEYLHEHLAAAEDYDGYDDFSVYVEIDD